MDGFTIFYGIVCILILVGLSALGISLMTNPEGWWRVTEKWKSNGTRSSYYFDRYTRIGGAVLVLVAVVGIIGIIYLLCTGSSQELPDTPEEIRQHIRENIQMKP